MEQPLLREHTPVTTDIVEGVSLDIPNGADDEEILSLATRVRPSWRQLRYHERGMAGFIHWGLNALTGNEWGDGSESPALFNPDNVDTDQWVQTFRDAGISCIVLVAKHHDGFCLWPSEHTEHCVRNSPWKGGQGDIVRAFTDSCHKLGTAVGIYYSPWDRHEPTYGTPAYNDHMINQLGELLTNYGEVDIVWFDGAGQEESTSGVRMTFDWPRIYNVIRKLQPRAVISGGCDTRWIGNEAGKGQQTQWAVQGVSVDDPFELASKQTLDLKAPTLGDIEFLRQGRLLHWLPARGGLPTRAGWFWHPNTDHTVRSLTYMVDSYFGTVGHNAHTQINLAPDSHGQAPSGERKLFRQMGAFLKAMYEVNLADGATVAADSSRVGSYGVDHLLIASPYDCWATEDGITQATIVMTLPEKRTFNVIRLQENVRDFGQRVCGFAIDVDDDGWREVYEGTTIGSRRLARIETVTSDRVRVRVTDARGCVSLGNFALFRAPVVIDPPVITRDNEGRVSIESAPGVVVHVTIDGAEPTVESRVYTEPIELSDGGVVTVLAVAVDGVDSPSVSAAMEFGLAACKLSVVDSGSGKGAPANAFDADLLASWDTSVWAPDAEPPHEIVIDLGESRDVIGFVYNPQQREYKGMIIPSGKGLIRGYSFQISDDGTTWGPPLCQGEFGNIEHNPLRQVVKASAPQSGRYVKFIATSAVERRHVSASEIGVIVTS